MIDAAAAGECAMIAKCVLVKTVHLSYLTPKEEEVQIIMHHRLFLLKVKQQLIHIAIPM